MGKYANKKLNIFLEEKYREYLMTSGYKKDLNNSHKNTNRMGKTDRFESYCT